MDFLNKAWDAIAAALKTANGYGVPIPIVLGAVALYFFMRRGMKWSTRQSYYIDMLKHLGIWKNSLGDRLDYYLEPESVYRPDPPGEHFAGLAKKGHEAYLTIKDQMPEARLFLSEASMQVLDHLVSEYWSITEIEVSSTAEYLERTFEEVKAAYEKLLAHAKSDLKRSQYLDIVLALKSK